MINTALGSLVEQKLSSVGEISRLAGVSPSTVYRWINGQTQPPYDAIRLLIRHLPNPRGQRLLLLCTVRGTPWQVRGPHDTLDVNRDGKVDADDALDSLIRVVRHATQSLGRIREAMRETPLDRQEMDEAVQTLEDVAIESCLAQQILTHIQQAHGKSPRRKARRQASNDRPNA